MTPPGVVAVAGCLFEVHLDGPSEWMGSADGAVSLISSDAGGRRFRFRAERAGQATLAFGATTVTVRIAPEDWAV